MHRVDLAYPAMPRRAAVSKICRSRIAKPDCWNLPESKGLSKVLRLVLRTPPRSNRLPLGAVCGCTLMILLPAKSFTEMGESALMKVLGTKPPVKIDPARERAGTAA